MLIREMPKQIPDSISVVNPFSNSVVGEVPKADVTVVHDAIDLAASYDFSLKPWDRYEILSRYAGLIRQRQHEISKLISEESGKTIRDSIIEVKRAYQTFLLSAEEAKRINGEIVPVDAVADSPSSLAFVLREPVGVITAITPFNFPLNLVGHKVGPALAANNPVIVKPSSQTPLSAVLMAEMLLEAGAPPEMIQIITGDSSVIGDALVTNPKVRKVTFTGSAKIGKGIAEKVGMKAICMELGGNDPLIILRDADLEKALHVALDGAFGANGQRCTSVKRIIIEDAVADEFVERFVPLVEKLTVGDQLDPNTDVGPLINESAAREVAAAVTDAVAHGAKLLCGGRRAGALFWPVVLDRVTPNMQIVIDETFGPVAPVIRVSSFDEAIMTANNTAFGLQSGVFTNRLDYAMEAARRIQAGAVMINKGPGFRAEHLPFGGVKDSGIGREGVRYAVESMSRLKTVVI